MKETDSRTSAFTKTSWKSKTDLNNHNYGTYLQELPLKYIYIYFFFQIAWAGFMYYDQLGKMCSLILMFLVHFQVKQSTQELTITMS